MHLYAQRIQGDAESCRQSFAAVDLLGFFISIVLSDDLAILFAETSETALEALLIVCGLNSDVYRGLNERFFVERLHLISPLQRLSIYQLRDTVDIAREVVDALTLVDSPCDSIYRLVGIDVGRVRSAPLKVFQQLYADVLILLSRFIAISVEGGEKAVERGLSENPLGFKLDFGETHVLNTLKTVTFEG